MSAVDPMRLRSTSAHRMRSGDKMESQDTGRVCTDPTCRTVLSRYNPATRCSRHAGWAEPAARRRSAR